MQPRDYEHPDWGRAGRVHEWKNYISDAMKLMWDDFTSEQKRIIAENAEEIASREEWD